MAFGSSKSLEVGSCFSGSSRPGLTLLAGGTGFFVFREKLKPDFGCDEEAEGGFAGRDGFVSGSVPSSSTRKSFDGRNGLSSASTAATSLEGVTRGAWGWGWDRGASVAGRPPRVPDAGVHDKLENWVGAALRPRPACGPLKGALEPEADGRRSGPVKWVPRNPPWPPRCGLCWKAGGEYCWLG